MEKMNFSRIAYFEALCNRILLLIKKRQLKNNKFDLMKEIDAQIYFINRKAQDGFWGICSGDITFIYFLNNLKEALTQRHPGISHLLTEAVKLSEKKIKVVFFAQETSVWPSLQSVYDVCSSDERYSVKLIYIPFYHNNIDTTEDNYLKYQEKGLPIINYTEYDLAADNPDIAFFVKPYDLIPKQFYIDEVDKIVRRCVYIPYGMEIGNSDESLRYQYKLLLHYRAWKILSYSSLYYERAVRYGYRNGKNYLKIGHPRFDLVNVDMRNDETVMNIKKLAKGRKIFMWNTHFTLGNDSSWGSYLIWGDFILDYAKEHQDIFLLWRPHPLFYKALEDVEGMDEIKVAGMFGEVAKYENIYIDKSDSYLNAFYVSEALISDATSFVPEYLAWEKPILYTPKPSGAGFSDKGIYDLLYIVNSPQDIYDFFNHIKNDIDSKKYIRMNNAGDHILLQNKGMIGKNLIDYITDEIVSEERNAV